MTRSQLEAVVEALVEVVDGWNDAAADEDRDQDAFRLTLREDGSGWVEICDVLAAPVEVRGRRDFDDMDGLIAILDGEGIDFEPEDRPA